MPIWFLIPFIFTFSALQAERKSTLLDDLLIAEYWDCEISDELPLYYNHLLYGGYFNMPSARMGKEGELGIGYASVPPYRLWNLRCQLTDRIEISGNYRVFKGIDDPILSQHGFGDLSDKGANVKFALFRPEDSGWRLPGLAIGWEDFLGTRSFKGNYIVLTKVFLNEDFECTLGYGWQRIDGLFGGATWMPFRRCRSPFLKGFALAAEYDATPYHDEHVEKHPKGRKSKSPVNVGVKYRLFDGLDFSLSYIRGCKWAGAASMTYNFGETKGFVTKYDDPLPYTSPRNIEPLGCRRPEEMMAMDLVYPFLEQGLDLLNVSIGYNGCKEKTLYLTVFNNNYRTEAQFRERLAALLTNLIPSDIASVVVTLNSEGFPVQQIVYPMAMVSSYGAKEMGQYQLDILTPMREVEFNSPGTTRTIFSQSMPLTNFYVEPKTNTYFGSSKGKFKYALGVHAGVDGFLPNNVYYSALLGLNFVSNIGDVSDTDRLNPSQIINVRSDIVNYYKNRGITLDELYLQKNWNLGNGFYSKLSGGYFDVAYVGLANEYLWYPLKYPIAAGIEGAIFKKRAYHGLGLMNHVRKLNGYTPTWRKFTGSQYFFNLYYRWYDAALDFKLSMGKFLANDYGVRMQVSRYFNSGLRIYLWYTITNGHDHINGELYYDKGVGFSMPLDIFYTHSDRERWGYGMSAWLRDVGVQTSTGLDLYEKISEERQK